MRQIHLTGQCLLSNFRGVAIRLGQSLGNPRISDLRDRMNFPFETRNINYKEISTMIECTKGSQNIATVFKYLYLFYKRYNHQTITIVDASTRGSFE